MSEPLNAILQQLGRIEGKVDNEIEASKSQRKTLFEKVDKLADSVAVSTQASAVLAEKTYAHVEADERRFKALESDVSSVKSKVSGMEMTAARKAGAVTLLGAISAVFGAVGAMAANLFRALN